MPSTLSWAQTLLLASSTLAFPGKRDVGSTISFDVVKVVGSAGSLRKRQTADVPFTQQSLFFIQSSLGTPAQTFYSQLDTGSSNLVIFPDSQKLAGSCYYGDQVCGSLTYNANQSTSAVNQTVSKKTTYGDGDSAFGYFYTDVLSIGGKAIDAFEFLYVTANNSLSSGVFGTGYVANEQYPGPGGSYPNLPQRLTSSKYINAPVFSLWLNNVRSTTAGSMLYGGIDSAKYCGNLVTLPFIPDPNTGIYREFNVQLNSITAETSTGNVTITNTPLSALLDTGTNLLSLPTNAYNALYGAYNASPASRPRGFPKVDCALGSSSDSLTFAFNNLVINVPLSQLIAQYPETGETKCSIYINVNTGTPDIILGTPFLTSAYVVYDLADNNAHMAQAVFDASTSRVTPVGSGTNVVPSVAGAVCSSTSTTTTTTATTAASTTTVSATTTESSSSEFGSTSTPVTASGSSTSSSAASNSVGPTIIGTTSTTTGQSSSSTSTSSGQSTYNASTSSSQSVWTYSTASYSTTPYVWSTAAPSSSASKSGWAFPTGAWPTKPAGDHNPWANWNGHAIPSGCGYSAFTTTTEGSVHTQICPYTTSTKTITTPCEVTVECPKTTVCHGPHISTSWSTHAVPTVCPYEIEGHPVGWDADGHAVTPALPKATGDWGHDGGNGGHGGHGGNDNNGGNSNGNGANGGGKGGDNNWNGNNGGKPVADASQAAKPSGGDWNAGDGKPVADASQGAKPTGGDWNGGKDNNVADATKGGAKPTGGNGGGGGDNGGWSASASASASSSGPNGWVKPYTGGAVASSTISIMAVLAAAPAVLMMAL